METRKTTHFNINGLSKHLMDKKMIGLFGISFVIVGILGYIPATINNSTFGMIGFAILTVIGVIFSTYGFMDNDEHYY